MNETRLFPPLRRCGVMLCGVLVITAGLLACSGPTDDGGDGEEETPDLTTVEYYDTVAGSWTSLHDTLGIPEPRSLAAVAAYCGKLYLFGGSKRVDLVSTRYKTVFIFDPGTNSWSQGASMSTNREGAGAVVVGDKIHVIGGALTSSTFLATMEIYDPYADTWTSGPSMATARYCPVVAYLPSDEKILVAGGMDESYTDLSSCEIYDTVSGSWSGTSSLSIPHGQACGGVIDDTLYLAGGFTESTTVTDVVESYAIGGGWSQGHTPMPSARGEMEGAVHGGLLYVVGGLYQDGAAQTVLSSFDVYDPVADSWSSLSSLPTARSEPSAVFIGDKLYVAGGYQQP